MEIQITAKDFELTDAIKLHVTEKIEPLLTRFQRVTQVRISLHIDHVDQIAEANVHVDSTEIHATASSEDMYLSIDLMLEKLISQMTKHKEKITDHHRH